MIETKTRKPLAYNIALAKIRDEQQKLYVVSQWLGENQKAINAIYKRFEKAPEGMLEYTPSITTYGTSWSMNCNFQITTRDLTGFKDERLLALLDLFIDADKVSNTDYAESLNRDYRFEFYVGDSAHVITVVICAYVKSESPTCRRILKETKMVTHEQKVWAMVCEDEVATPITAD